MKVKLKLNLFKRFEKKKQDIVEEKDEEQIKVRRRGKEVLNGETIEEHEQKKWKRKGSRKNRFEFLKNIFLNKRRIKFNYYVLLFAMILLSTLSVYITSKSYNNKDYENYTSLSVFSVYDDINNLNLEGNDNIFEEKELILENKNQNNVINTNTKINNNVKTNTNIVQKKEETLNFGKPLSGEIQKIYSVDKVIYSKTLEMWKVHNGIDISGRLGEDVVSIEKGTVIKIYDDSFYGKTIVIDHGQGYISSYSNLDDEVYVKVNNVVKKGQKIGKIGSTSIGEIKDNPHIHFMIYKDEQEVDPSSIIYK